MTKKTILAISLLITTNTSYAANYNSISLGSVDVKGKTVIDYRYHNRMGKMATNLSVSFLVGSNVPKQFSGLMLGAGLQLPRKLSSPYYYGLGSYIIFSEKKCESVDMLEQERCQNSNEFFEGSGNDLAIYPEIGARFKVGNNKWITASTRYWLSTSDELRNRLSAHVGFQF